MGEIISGYDWSYATQQDHKVCDVDQLSLKTLSDYDESKVVVLGDYKPKTKAKSKNNVRYLPAVTTANDDHDPWWRWPNEEIEEDPSEAVCIKRAKNNA